MTITKTRNDAELTIAVAGRLDTVTAPQLEAELKQSIEGVTRLTFDLTELEYISSAGLRVLLSAQKAMNKQGSMLVSGANATVSEVFDITGFCDVLTIV